MPGNPTVRYSTPSPQPKTQSAGYSPTPDATAPHVPADTRAGDGFWRTHATRRASPSHGSVTPRPITLPKAMLANDLTSPPLRHSQPPLEHLNSSAPLRRAHYFVRLISRKASISSSLSATIRFNRAFSTSKDFNRFTSSALKPPYWLRHLWNVCSDTSRCRATSAMTAPSPRSRSASRNLHTIYSGACLLRFAITVILLPTSNTGQQTHTTSGPNQGGHANKANACDH